MKRIFGTGFYILSGCIFFVAMDFTDSEASFFIVFVGKLFLLIMGLLCFLLAYFTWKEFKDEN